MVRIAGSLGALVLICALAGQDSTSKSSSAGQVAIQRWSGTLMDASCGAGPEGSQAANESGTQSAEVDKGRPEKGHKGKAEAQSCPVSNSTRAFALKTKEGKVVKFDAIGNARAAEELKAKGGWAKDLSAGKPIRARVSGTLNGDMVTVTSIT